MNAVDLDWLREVRRAAWQLPPIMKVADYADQHRSLPGTSALPGRWKTSRTEYLREIMNCLSVDSPHEKVVVMSAAQLGKTEIALNFISYIIANSPGTCLLVSPTDAASRRMCRLRLDPLIDNDPVLSTLVVPRRRAQSGNTESQKRFVGGNLFLVGANSATNLRSAPVCYLLCDEVDQFPESVGDEGDPLGIAEQRTTTYEGRRKLLFLSTPTLKGISRIEKAYLEGDRREYQCPCPFCNHFQVLRFERLRWPAGDCSKAYYQCIECSKPIQESYKSSMVAKGKWVATAQSPTNSASFHLNSLISPFVRWEKIALENEASQSDPARLQAWYNSFLGEPFEDSITTSLSPMVLLSRAVDFQNPPIGVVVSGVDCQIDRLELEILGFGRGEEAWSLEYLSLPGSPFSPDVWHHLEAVLRETYCGMKVSACCIDSAYASAEVYRFCAPRFHRKIFAVRGTHDQTHPIWTRRPSRPKDGRLANLYTIGSQVLKKLILARLGIEKPGPGYFHHPVRDLNYFEQLLNERPVRRFISGRQTETWIKPANARTEARDARMYCLAALAALRSYGFDLDKATDNRSSNRPQRRMSDFAKLNS